MARLPFLSAEQEDQMKQRKSLGIPPHLYAVPLTGARHTTPPYEWTVEASARNAIALRQGKLDLAFLTPLEYARESSLYYIVPGLAISSRGGDGTVVLLFREAPHKLTSLAVDPSSASEIVLARVILAEQFNARPTLLPYQGTPEEALQKADAVLVAGDVALRMFQERENALDLVEEWEEMTTLPFVYGIWCGREHAADADDRDRLLQLCAEGRGDFHALSEGAARDRRLGSMDALQIQDYLEALTYDATEEVEEGMREFMRFAYYHGVLPDVADLQYYGSSSESDDEPPPAPPSLH
jgi:chorismate dehydratase